jgi:putative ABC transport system permease protein
MIPDFKMGWRNIWRNPRRTLLTIAAISFACMLLIFMLSFQFGSYQTMIDSSVKMTTGHIQIQAKGFFEKRQMRFSLNNPVQIAQVLDTVPAVSAYTFRNSTFAMISSENRTRGIMVVGVIPKRESKVSTLKSIIREGSFLVENENNQAIIGRLLAQSLKVKVGDELTLLGQGWDGGIAATVVIVKGIYSSGVDEFDRSAIQISLNDFQEIFNMAGKVHEVVVVCDSLDDVPIVKGEIEKKLRRDLNRKSVRVLDWDELLPGLMQSIKMDLVSGVIMYFILVMVVAFSIFNTFLMVIFERTREFGVMMAVGVTPGRLTRLLLLESFSLISIGIGTGIIGGCLITLIFQNTGIVIYGANELMAQFGMPNRIFPQLTLLSVIAGPALLFFITVIAALYPALKVRSLRPVEALNHV